MILKINILYHCKEKSCHGFWSPCSILIFAFSFVVVSLYVTGCLFFLFIMLMDIILTSLNCTINKLLPCQIKGTLNAYYTLRKDIIRYKMFRLFFCCCCFSFFFFVSSIESFIFRCSFIFVHKIIFHLIYLFELYLLQMLPCNFTIFYFFCCWYEICSLSFVFKKDDILPVVISHSDIVNPYEAAVMKSLWECNKIKYKQNRILSLLQFLICWFRYILCLFFFEIQIKLFR